MKRALAFTAPLICALAVAQCGAPRGPETVPVIRRPASGGGNGDDPPVIISNNSVMFSTPSGWTADSSGKFYVENSETSTDALLTVYLGGGSPPDCSTVYSSVTKVEVTDKDGYVHTLTLTNGQLVLTPDQNEKTIDPHGHRLELGSSFFIGKNYVTQVAVTLQAASGQSAQVISCPFQKNDDPVVAVVPHT